MVTDIIKTLEQENTVMQLAKVLPDNLDMARFQRIVISALRTTPKLAACAPDSILAAVMGACQLGLEPNTPEGLCYLIPRKGACNLEVGYKGMLRLAWDSGKVIGISAAVRYENDQFSMRLGSNENISHVPAESNRGAMVGAYAIVSLVSGGHIMRYLPADEVLATRPPYWEKSPWGNKNPFIVAEMWCKTAIKRVLKHAPLSPEIQRAVAYDETYSRGAALNYDTGEAQIIEPGTDQLQLPAREGKS